MMQLAVESGCKNLIESNAETQTGVYRIGSLQITEYAYDKAVSPSLILNNTEFLEPVPLPMSKEIVALEILP